MFISQASVNAAHWRFAPKLPAPSALWILVLVAAIGCGENWAPVVPASGTVKFNGKAPAGARLVLHAVNPPNEDAGLAVSPTASVKGDGSFVVTSYQAGDGAAPGDYIVTVEWYQIDKNGNPGPNVIPKQYASPKTSPIKVTINDGGPTTLDPIDISANAAARTARHVR